MILKHKSILVGLFIVSFLIIIVNSGYCADNRLTSVNDVDSFDVIAYKKNNTTLYVSFLYKNHRTDQLVFWQNTSCDINCDVYELIGDGHNKQKGRNLGSYKGSLNSYSQGIYIDVVETNEPWGLADCGWTYGGKKYYSERKFKQRKTY